MHQPAPRELELEEEGIEAENREYAKFRRHLVALLAWVEQEPTFCARGQRKVTYQSLTLSGLHSARRAQGHRRQACLATLPDLGSVTEVLGFHSAETRGIFAKP